MNRILIKLSLFALSIFFILNVSCKSTGSTSGGEASGDTSAAELSDGVSAPEVTETPEIVELPAEAEKENITEEVIEDIAEAELPAQSVEEELSDLFVEELISGIIEDFPEKTKPVLAAQLPAPEPPVVTAITPPPAPVPTPAAPPQPTPAPQSAPIVQVPPAPAEPELIEEEPAPPPARYVPDYPPTRLDSIAQMGRTPLDTEIIYSRIVRATVGQTVEIPFRGNGWVYLGETASRKGIVYNSRRNESEGQSFIFSLEEAGVYTLRFYRQDFIRDFIINDHVQVIVADAVQAAVEQGWFTPPADRGKVVAQPRWPSPLEEAQIRSGARLPSEPTVTAEPSPSRSSAQTVTPTPRTSGQPSSATTRPSTAADRSSTASTRPSSASATAQPPATVAQAPSATAQQSSTAAAQPSTAQSTASRQPDAPQTSSQSEEFASVAPPIQNAAQLPASETAPRTRELLAPEVLLDRAEKSFEGGNVAEAITFLNYFLEDYPSGSDELYWLLGQYYEANSPSRNILLSLDYYKRLVNEYPQSRRLNDARRRIAYLERFYINIQ